MIQPLASDCRCFACAVSSPAGKLVKVVIAFVLWTSFVAWCLG